MIIYYRQELTSTSDVITTVASNPDVIGYASLASVKDTVKALTVDGVKPSEATIKDGSYVVQRPLRSCNQERYRSLRECSEILRLCNE